MNKLFIFQSLIHFNKLKTDKGFTLIELIIVILVLSVLSVIALPSTIKQAAKAREVEGKNNLGLLSRAQQTYHFETTTFSNSNAQLLSNVVLQTRYYSFPDPTVATNSIVKHQAIALNPTSDQVRNYATGVYFNSSAFAVVVCESSNVGITVNVPDNITDPCTNGGTRIR